MAIILERIAWSDDLKTGCSHADAKHNSLVCLYNDHVRYIKAGVSAISVKGSFDILLSEMRHHFTEDCAQIGGSICERKKAFLADHQGWLHSMDSIYCFSSEPDAISAFTPTLRSWVMAHLEWDKELMRLDRPALQH
ncbi:hypothetical protein [Azospirillum sp. sgz302134]